jgi:cytosine/adenosine deaminase-related metal-dependent hydrolase
MITDEQKVIARREAYYIVRDFRDSLDEEELEEAIYEALIEALRHGTEQ